MAEGRSAVFLDRDGTLMRDTGYPRTADEVELLPGAADAVRRLNEMRIPVIVVTNQSGIARGLLSRADFEATQDRLRALLEAADARIDATYMCPHHPEVDGPCDCRKPGLALYKQAAREHDLDLARSFFLGDRWRDVAVTRQVGGTPILVGTGQGAPDAPPEIERVPSLVEGVDRILAATRTER